MNDARDPRDLYAGYLMATAENMPTTTPKFTAEIRALSLLGQLQAFLARVRYRPGWRFEARANTNLCLIEVDVSVLVVNADDQDSDRPLPITFGFSYDAVFIRHVISSEGAFLAWMRDVLLDIERHEFGEFFRFDDRKPFDPHAPKHTIIRDLRDKDLVEP